MAVEPHGEARDSVYLSAVDGGCEHSLEQIDFDNSLIYNLLFEERPLVLPDIFFFNSRFLISHMRDAKARYPLFATALRSGLIVPAFRSRRTPTFVEVLAEFDRTRVLGIEHGRYDVRAMAEQYDRDFRRSPLGEPKWWPEDMGSEFERTVFATLTGSECRNLELADFWTATEQWRTECVEGAKAATAATGGTGIRRAEIWNVVGRELGFLGRGEKFVKPRELLDAAQSAGDAELVSRLRFFIDIVNVCYQQTQAAGFGGLQNIPRALSHSASALYADGAGTPPAETPDVILCDATVPTPEALLRAESNEIIAIRKGDHGQAYFNAREAWIANPTEDTEGELLERLDAYCDRIGTVAVGKKQEVRLSVARLPHSAAAGVASTALMDLMAGQLELPPAYALVTTATGIAVSALVTLAEFPRSESQKLELRFSAETGGVEINRIPESR
ncbi:hypothetical protein LO762_28505 [Actinocorallia sp. API 0066]|uniref:hypothetical protein n=1 Tax=Actinocorallia sp. API 0066 TaxID=2896846 RepID=UPI001E4EA0D0|nr:hypothetical protein [Actinocorallia sp. API 0066]MCD0453095.1 hypothetical protein [Actinocorallia sp. API 0066]